jgi:2-keto-4-pentenoate hydratase
MTEDDVGIEPEVLAKRLDDAWENRRPLAPLSESEGLDAVEEAYAVQTAWTELRLRDKGEKIVGRKIGLTNFAIQEQLGVNEPDYGSLWASRQFPVSNGRAELPAEVFIAPRLEGEIAFLIGRSLAGPDVTLQEVLAATEALAVAVEVVDSRIEDWRIKLADTIADNASHGGFVVGPWTLAYKRMISVRWGCS